MILQTLLVITTLVSILYYYVTRTFNYWKKRNVAGPKPVALFGNIIDMSLQRKHISVINKEIYDSFPDEKVVGIFRMTTPCVYIRDPEIIKHVMIKDFNVFVDRGVQLSEDGLGRNLFHADGETWRILRSKFTPLFTSGKLKNMMYLVTERGDKFTDYIQKKHIGEKETNVQALFQKFTASTITACAFGLDVEIDTELKELAELDKAIFTMPYLTEFDMMYPGALKKLNLSIFSTSIKNFFDSMVKTVITQRNGKPSTRNDFMDLILDMRQKGDIQGAKRDDTNTSNLEVSESLIAAQAFVFYAAGYETSSVTLTFMAYHLALNPDIQDKMINEVDEVLNKHGGVVNYDTINDLTYMKQVFDETLRLYPVVDPLQRIAEEDYKVPGTDITIEKGQMILVSPYSIHRDPKYFPEPEKFDPERFSPENSRDRHPCAYLPFGVGPRNCIGMRFAQVQSRVCMLKFLSKYRVEPSKSTPSSIEFGPRRLTIGPNDGLYLRVVPRHS